MIKGAKGPRTILKAFAAVVYTPKLNVTHETNETALIIVDRAK